MRWFTTRHGHVLLDEETHYVWKFLTDPVWPWESSIGVRQFLEVSNRCCYPYFMRTLGTSSMVECLEQPRASTVGAEATIDDHICSSEICKI